MISPRKAKLPRCNDDLATLDECDSHDKKKCVNTDVRLIFDVLTIIFKNLSAKDLCNAAIVCRSWNEAAENEKRGRSVGAVALSIDFDDSWTDANQFADQLQIKPMCSIMFTRPFDKRHPAIETNDAECPCRFLPFTCRNIIVGNNGVIKDNCELEENPEKATWMLLPHDKDVTIETICVPVDRRKGNPNPESQHNAEMRLECLLSRRSTAKCFILLTKQDVSSELDILRNMGRYKKLSFSGGVVCNLSACIQNRCAKWCRRPMAWIAIFISGPSVHSWSIVLERSCNTKGKVVAKLELLKRQVQLRKHSMGFMFACQGRGKYIYREKNVESNAFKKLFPDVPLVGCFGGGEYGDSTVAYKSKSASILHRVYDCYLRLSVKRECHLDLESLSLRANRDEGLRLDMAYRTLNRRR